MEDPNRGTDEPARRAPGHPTLSLVRTAVVFYGVLFGIAWCWSAIAHESLLYATPAAAARGVRPWLDTGIGVVSGLLVILLSDQLVKRTATGDTLARALAQLLGRLSLAQCGWLAVASGVAEESLFRGALQPHVGLVAAALLFGLAHFVPRRDLWIWSVFAVAAGLLLGVLFDATGNLVAPAVAHVVINAVNLRLLTQRYGSSMDDSAVG